MKSFLFILVVLCLKAILLTSCNQSYQPSRVFDVHLHGSPDVPAQLAALRKNNVNKVAVSTSWKLQQFYESSQALSIIHGLMLPCPGGKVPYSGQPCFDNGSEWPSLEWVEELMRTRKIQFLGEVLTQYHGISMSDSSMFPYYSLAEKYNIPVGIHAGSAGPDHGCPNFREEMGTPLLLEDALKTFPRLRVWIMHAGGPYLEETIRMMKNYPQLYTDISVANNPAIVPPEEFGKLINRLIEEGFGDRIMFGSDNADIRVAVHSVVNLHGPGKELKDKILFGNAERFFSAR
jgi:hypothetical protein